MKSKGIDVNTDSLRTRVKGRKTIMQLEDNADKKATKRLADDSDEDAMVTDERVGRKRKRSASSDSDMDID